MSDKSETLKLAYVVDVFDAQSAHLPLELYSDISSELRRLHEVNKELLEALEAALKLIELVMPVAGDVTRKARAAVAKATIPKAGIDAALTQPSTTFSTSTTSTAVLK